MEKEIYKKGEVKLEVVGKDLLITLDTKGVDVTVRADAEYFLKELAEKIPGKVDDTIIEILVGALKV